MFLKTWMAVLCLATGWVAISNATGDRDRWFEHGLGEVPRLVMLWLAENADGSGWMVPAMSPPNKASSWRGTLVYRLNERWALVRGGNASLAEFIDNMGTPTRPTSGYVRLLAWR